MKLRKTKSAIAIILSIMLILSTMLVAPMSASAAKVDGDPVGENKQMYGVTGTDYVRYGFKANGQDTIPAEDWQNTDVNIASEDYPNTGIPNVTTTYVTDEIEIPEGMNHIECVFHAGYDLGDERWYKLGAAGAPGWPFWGETDQPHWAYNQQGGANIDMNVIPGSKIRFRFIRFEQDGECLVYAVTMTSLPDVGVDAELGDVSIEVDPEHGAYDDDRDVTITVSNINGLIPAGDIEITPSFAIGRFTPDTQAPVEGTDGSGNRIVTLTGTLSGFTAADASATPYTATAVATTAQPTYYDQGAHTVYSFTADPATDDYYIDNNTPTQDELSVGDVEITVTPARDGYTVNRDVTITVTNINANLPLGEIAVTYNFPAGTENLTRAENTDDHTITYTGTLSFTQADVSVDDYTATAEASSSYSYLDTVNNVQYSFSAANDTASYHVYDEATEVVTITLTVDPTSMVYDGAAELTARVHYPTHFPEGNDYMLYSEVTDSTGKPWGHVSTVYDRPNRSMVFIYRLDAGRYDASDVGTVTFTGVPKSSEDMDTRDHNVLYHFELGPEDTATLTLLPKEGTVPVVDTEESGALVLDVTPEVDLYSAARKAAVTVSSIDPHIYANYGDYDEITLTLTDDKGNTWAEDVTKRGNITATSFTTEFDVPANTYSVADVGTVTYTVSVDYTGTDIYDSTTATTYSFTDGQTAQDTSELINNVDTNLNPQGYMLTLLEGLVTSIGITSDKLDGYENVYMVVSTPVFPGGTVIYPHEDGNLTLFDYDKVYPHLVVDDITSVIYGTKNGIEYHSEPYVRSVKSYVYDTLRNYQNNNTDYGVALKSTLVSLLNYAAAIQTKKNYKTDELVNAELTPAQLAYDTYSSDCVNIDNKDYVVNPNATCTWGGSALVFDSNVQYMVQVETPVKPEEGWYAIARAGGADHRIDTLVSPGAETGGVQPYYIVTIEDMWISQVDREIELTLYDADGNALTNTMLTSFASFSARRTDLSAIDRAAVDAMMKYGRAAMVLSEEMKKPH